MQGTAYLRYNQVWTSIHRPRPPGRSSPQPRPTSVQQVYSKGEISLKGIHRGFTWGGGEVRPETTKHFNATNSF